MDVSVIIATANRAPDLRDTLTSLAEVRQPGQIELLVVDNCSTDDTRMVVEDAARHYPFPLRYLYEGENGKYAALNAGIAGSTGRVIAATDDDARFEKDWLERAVDGLTRYDCDFVGGRVLPIWGGPKPAWLAERNGLTTKSRTSRSRRPCSRAPATASLAAACNVVRAARLSNASDCSTTGSDVGDASKSEHNASGTCAPAHGRCPRLRIARHGRASPRVGVAARETVFPAVALLARHQPRHIVPTERLRHGRARARAAAERRRATNRRRPLALHGQSAAVVTQPRVARTA